MPFTVRRRGSKYQVVNTETGEPKARPTSKAKADRQVHILKGVEKHWTPTGEPDVYMRKIKGRTFKLCLSGGGSNGSKRRGKGNTGQAEQKG